MKPARLPSSTTHAVPDGDPDARRPRVTSRRRMLSLLAGAGGAVLVGGCTSLVSRPAPVKRTFLLDPPLPPANAAPPKPLVLRVGAINVAAPFRGKTFVYRRSDLGYEADYYDEFFVPPATMLADATAQGPRRGTRVRAGRAGRRGRQRRGLPAGWLRVRALRRRAPGGSGQRGARGHVLPDADGDARQRAGVDPRVRAARRACGIDARRARAGAQCRARCGAARSRARSGSGGRCRSAPEPRLASAEGDGLEIVLVGAGHLDARELAGAQRLAVAHAHHAIDLGCVGSAARHCGAVRIVPVDQHLQDMCRRAAGGAQR